MKKYSIILIISLISTFINANFIKVDESSLFVPKSIGEVELYHNQDGFHIFHEGETKPIKNYFVDPILRNISNEKLDSFQQHGYIIVKKMNDGEFTLNARARGNGGGPVGIAVGVFVGKGAVCAVGYGASAAVSAVATPAAGFLTQRALLFFFTPIIQSTSNVAALACGIMAGAASGPL